jgi:predicted nucleic acid-binding protein
VIVLVDTSVWAAALRRRGGDAQVRADLARRVAAGETRIHPYVLGELVLGGLGVDARGRLEAQRAIPAAGPGEVLAFVDRHELAGARIGWVDCALLASAEAAGAPLWTLDRSLAEVAGRLALRFDG